MLDEDFVVRLAVVGQLAGEHLEEHHPAGVNVDALVVLAAADLGGHVVDGADPLSLLLVARHRLAQAVVADLEAAVLDEDVGRLQVPVDDALVVQIADGAGQCPEPLADEVLGQAGAVPLDDLGERFAEDVLHDDPGVAVLVLADVVHVDEVGVLQVQAVEDAAHLDFALGE